MKSSSILKALLSLGLCLVVWQVGILAEETSVAGVSNALCKLSAGVPSSQGGPSQGGLTAELPVPLAGNCTATADCGPYPDVSCEATSSTVTCTAVDRNCVAGQRGYVRCGSSTTSCPVCPSSCSEGATRWVTSGCCCEFLPAPARIRSVEQECVNGTWTNTGNTACAGQCPNQEVCEL